MSNSNGFVLINLKNENRKSNTVNQTIVSETDDVQLTSIVTEHAQHHRFDSRLVIARMLMPST